MDMSALCFTGLIMLCAYNSAVAAPSHEEGSTHFTRLNLGLAFSKLRDIQIADGIWTHTFHLKLPHVSDAAVSQHPCLTNISACLPQCKTDCSQLLGLLSAVNVLTSTMRQSITHFVKRAYSVIPDIQSLAGTSTKRRARAPLEFVGDASNWLFGTARVSDVNALKAAITQMQKGIEISVADAQRSREGLVSITRLQNQRLDTLHAVLRDEQASLSILQADARAASETTALEINALTATIKELARFVSLHDDLQEVSAGLEETLHGQISPKLITVTQLRNMITDVNTELAKSSARLCYTTVREVYASRSFDVARIQSDIVVRLRLAYSKHPKFQLYNVLRFASPVPGQQGYVSRIHEFPNYLLIEPTRGLVGELEQLPQSDVVDYANIRWHKIGAPSCVRSVLTDNVNATGRFCDFSIRREQLTPSLTKLSEGIYVASNYSDLRISCPNVTAPPQTDTACELCLLQVGCACEIHSGTEILTRERECSSEHDTTSSILHAVNLPLLRTFYEVANETLSGRTLVSAGKRVTPQPLSLPIFGHNITQLLAADKAAGFSLSKLANSLRNSSVVYHTPADAIIHSVLERLSASPSFWGTTSNWMTWLNCLSYALVTALIILWYMTHRRLAVLAAAMTMSMAKTNAYELREEFIRTPPSEAPSLNMTVIVTSLVTQVRTLDTVLTIVIICIIAMLACIYSGVAQEALGRRSHIYLEILSMHRCMQIRLATLPDATRRCVVRVSSSSLSIRLHNYYFFGVLHISPKPPKIVNTLTGETTRLSKTKFLLPWTAWKLRRHLAAGSYTVSPMLVHSHQYTFMNDQAPPSYNEQVV